MTEKQFTLAKEISFNGKGLHTGKVINITLKPAPVNSGYVFKRIDIDNQPEIKAIAENVVATERNTTLESNGIQVYTVEHLLAALYAIGVDNAIIELDGPEVPIISGNAVPFVEKIKEAGLVQQEAERNIFEVTEKISYKNEERGSEITIFPDKEYSLDVHIEFNSTLLSNQFAHLDKIENFEKEIAPARTFVFFHELQNLVKNNLIKGGDFDNAIVLVDKEVSEEELDNLAKFFNKPKINVTPGGTLNNIELYFPNEPARHKLLDLIGDLALTGVRLKGRVVAYRPGHFVNTEFAKLLRKQIKKEISKPKPPEYDPNKPPVFDVIQIMKILPHRPPFLLVDKITYMDEWTICGIKNVTMNEAFFVGHYPEEPIMPGVLQIEAMAQVGGVLLLSMVPDPENYLLYFLKIENVKFKHKVVPGDTLNIRMVLKEPVRRGIALTYGQGFVGDKLVVECEFMAQMTRKDKVLSDNKENK